MSRHPRRTKTAARGAPPPLLQEALRLHQSGHLDEAAERYRRVLEADPGQADALHLLGVVAHQRGDAAAAVDLIGRAVKRNPGAATYLNNLGAALLALGRHGEAERQFRRALKARPDYVEALTNLGGALQKSGQGARAEQAYRRALALDPARADAHNNLGSLLHDRGQVEGALEHYRAALDANPHYVDAHANLGNALMALGETAAAESQYRQALAVQAGHLPATVGLARALALQDRPVEAEAVLRAAVQSHGEKSLILKELGDVLQDTDRTAAAEDCFRRALAADPDDGAAAAALASLMEKASRLDEAADMARGVLGREPGNVAAALVLAKCARRSGDGEDGLARLAAVDGEGQPADARAAIHFERGAILDRLGRYDEAFDAYLAANGFNHAHWRTRATDRDVYLDEIARLEAAFTPDWVASWSPPVPGDAPPPLFLIGFPRSGTTLLDQMLNAHPAIHTLEELPAVDLMKEALAARRPYPQTLADLDAETVAHLRAVYAAAIADHAGPAAADKLIVDKMPLNTTDVGLIHRVFPTARFLLSIRHPCDVCLSGFMQAFRPNPAMVHFDTIDNTARLYDRVMTLWNRYREVLPIRYHRIRYEDLVADMAGEVGRILEFLDLPWDDAVMGYAEKAKKRRIKTPSYHQVVQPIYNRSVARWLNYRRHFDGALPLLAPHVAAFGYPPPDES
ncbi:MAG: sulfotransferase [Hyphomicrobiales bacterium]|nr:sulfotransferase [Hyphomicrobiales bacterium]MCP5370478.1 sulfotransferase [Hyphomicrobiales bacterium]